MKRPPMGESMSHPSEHGRPTLFTPLMPKKGCGPGISGRCPGGALNGPRNASLWHAPAPCREGAQEDPLHIVRFIFAVSKPVKIDIEAKVLALLPWQ